MRNEGLGSSVTEALGSLLIGIVVSALGYSMTKACGLYSGGWNANLADCIGAVLVFGLGVLLLSGSLFHIARAAYVHWKPRPTPPSLGHLAAIQRRFAVAGLSAIPDLSTMIPLRRTRAKRWDTEFEVSTEIGAITVGITFAKDAIDFGVASRADSGVYVPPWVTFEDPPPHPRDTNRNVIAPWVHWFAMLDQKGRREYMAELYPRTQRDEWVAWIERSTFRDDFL